jgi:hypothetical protein
MTLDEVAKIEKELLGARSEAAITEEFGAPAAICSKSQRSGPQNIED